MLPPRYSFVRRVYSFAILFDHATLRLPVRHLVARL